MHTLKVPGPSGSDGNWIINHNGDFSGVIIIRDYTCEARPEIHVPYHVLEAIVAKKIRQEAIEAIEGMDDHDLLRFMGT